MHRRALLASLSTGLGALAGCNTSQGDSSDPSTTPANGSDDSPPSEDQSGADWEPGAASIIDLETGNRTYALTPLEYRSDDAARIQMRFASTATPEAPATVEATLTNENSFENTFRLQWTPPFGRLYSEIPHPIAERNEDHTYRVALIFAPTENHDLVDDPPDIERGTDGFWRLAPDSRPELPNTIRLGPDETVRGEYVLVGHPEGNGRGRPAGIYEFHRGDGDSIRVTVWNTDAPGPASDAQFRGVSVPAVPGASDIAWFHDADASTPTFVRPSAERTDLPARVEFTFVNRSRNATSCGHWNFYKLQDGDWFHLGPFIHTDDCRAVDPGTVKTWTIRAANGEMAPCNAHSFPYLGGGRYAAVAGYGHETAHTGALVEFVAPPASVVPTDDATTERTGGSIQVTTDKWRNAPESDYRSQSSVVLERAEMADRRLIAEQVMRRRNRGYRNSLPFLGPDVDEVVLRTDDGVANDVLGHEDETTRFQYDGQAYRITRRSA